MSAPATSPAEFPVTTPAAAPAAAPAGLAAVPPAPYPRRWAALGVLAFAQLVVVLDGTVVNVALPTAQADLGITDADRQWVVTAYTLAFGGLLLLGGRLADRWGRRRTFLVGMAGFAAASAAGGLASTGGMLFAARAVQGTFGALLVPAAGALVSVMFGNPGERARAYAVYGAVAGTGSAIGLLAGGVLAQYASWRWCLLVNVPVAAGVLVAATVVPADGARPGGPRRRYDLPGAVLATSGLTALVYAAGHAADHGWTAPGTAVPGLAGLALLAAFARVEVRAACPLLPLRLVADRAGAYLAALLAGAGLLGAFLFLMYYLQVIHGYRPARAGVASLPVTAGILVAATLAGRVLPRVGARRLVVTGALLAAAALLGLTRLGVTTGYAGGVLPAAVLLGLGFGLVVVPLSNVALLGVPPRDTGAASAAFNATQQVGGSLGVAVLNTVCTAAVARHAGGGAAALVHGYATGFGCAAVLLLGCAAAVTFRSTRPAGP